MSKDAGNSLGKKGGRPINCDQVAWLLDIFDRYLPPSKHPGISREREMMKYGMLYEVMEIAYLRFEDESALHNGTPHEARLYQIYDELNPKV